MSEIKQYYPLFHNAEITFFSFSILTESLAYEFTCVDYLLLYMCASLKNTDYF